ncbi:hypothetical protein H112_03456 [Trichophyton rubrum D6]|uniref:37S ribosomal protein mrp10, mitochondrial n=3 Tax=Trichophyton TaxID=5550 RepID=F2SQB8_TRIRC|nr:uncharacterized protein TERG_04782 [Trichophyton rubrum CBS 118892]EZF23980.1 hypothetical protein H100_03461 [Trichophyton rubrum MR850]EZF42986.1 hypothetical protein H102_03456 [Trichophyton rubrum CBS 100081]EZF53676.1 hypothetical protein H103_03465 [Trichophyton rubrum CBS 288.86]EZF64253.1 hypothetical protein H104_03450 [Trichophyton rubrum CBS 289.86]EZF74791.1 hypothetical protein H105_03477 [Trichophyton soudanense CBS 452.61]EZF85549.1 hypothetical protein H110_03462 [Trichophy
MPPKSAATAGTIRLQSLPRLKIKSPMKYDQNPCLAAMTAVLSKFLPWINWWFKKYLGCGNARTVANISFIILDCWGATGYSVQGCLALEQQLRLCTDSHPTKVKRKNTVNYHLARMFRMISPRRKEK